MWPCILCKGNKMLQHVCPFKSKWAGAKNEKKLNDATCGQLTVSHLIFEDNMILPPIATQNMSNTNWEFPQCMQLYINYQIEASHHKMTMIFPANKFWSMPCCHRYLMSQCTYLEESSTVYIRKINLIALISRQKKKKKTNLAN